MSDPDRPSSRRSSSVLDAIFERVDSTPDRPDGQPTLFRAKALEQLDVAVEIDNQLPLVPRRTWMLLIGAVILVLGFILWAAFTPSMQTVSAEGRAVGTGIVAIPAPASGVVLDALPEAGAPVAANAPLTRLETARGIVQASSTIEGTTWQPLIPVGAAASAGQPIVTVLPANSGAQTILMLPESLATNVVAGQDVQFTGGGRGTVLSVGSPLPASDASSEVGLTLTGTQLFIPVSVAMAEPIRPGTQVSAQIVLSSESVLSRLLGQ